MAKCPPSGFWWKENQAVLCAMAGTTLLLQGNPGKMVTTTRDMWGVPTAIKVTPSYPGTSNSSEQAATSISDLFPGQTQKEKSGLAM